MKPYYIVLFSFILITSKTSVSGQILFKASPPEFIAACGPTYTYSFELQATDDNAISNLALTYELPDGMLYLENSISGEGISEQDVAISNQPRFSISTIDNTPTKFFFQAMGTCDIENTASNLRDKIKISFGGSELEFTGPNYNRNVVFPEVVEVTNFDAIANIGDTFIRTITIRNGGFGPISSLILEDEHDSNSLNLIDVNPGRTIEGNSVLIRISDADFEAIGNADKLLDNGEEITIRQELQVLDCKNTTSRISLSWGCGLEACQVFSELVATVSQDLNSPLLRTIKVREEYAGFCSQGYLEFLVINKATEVNEGAASALDLSFESGMSGLSYNSELDTCLGLGDFMINGQLMPLDNQYENTHRTAFSQFTFDPDGPNGLSDADGDGVFDDLRAGDTVRIGLKTNFNDNCLGIGCSQDFKRRSFNLRAFYGSQCDPNPSYRYINGIQHSYSFNFSSNVEEFKLFGEAKDSLEVHLRFYGVVSGFQENCSRDSAIIHLQLPDVLKLAHDFQPIWGGREIPFETDGRMLHIYTGQTSGLLELVFLADCDSIETEQEGLLPCGGIEGDGHKVYNIPYWMDYLCDSDSCLETQRVVCDSTQNFVFICPVPPSEVGIVNQQMAVRRTSLGWTGPDLSTKVDPLNPSLRLEHALTYDTVLFELTGDIIGPGNFDTTTIQISYNQEEGAQFFSNLWNQLEYYDSETNIWLECSINPSTVTFDTSNFEVQYSFSLLELRSEGQCLEGIHITNGDKIVWKGYFMITEDAPKEMTEIPNLHGRFAYQYENRLYECGGHFRILKIMNPSFRREFESDYSGEACDTIEFIFTIYQGQSSDISDLFPQEFRPLVRWDSMQLRFPQWVDYVSNSAVVLYQYRENNTAGGEILTESTHILDPTIATDQGMLQLDFKEDTEFPSVDYITKGTIVQLRFKIKPNCLTSGSLHFNQDVYLTENLYSEDHRKSIREIDKSLSADYGIGRSSLRANNPIFYGISDTASWAFSLCYSYGASKYSPNNWLYMDIPAGIQPIAIIESTSNGERRSHPIMSQLGDQGYWVRIDSVYRYQCRQFELLATFTACEQISFKIYSGFSCSSYPENFENLPSQCTGSPTDLTLTLDPRQANLQINLVKSPADAIQLCDPLIFEYKIINSGVGAAIDLTISMDLADEGISILSGSSQIRLGEGNYIQIQDPIRHLETNTLVWELEDDFYLAGLNQRPENEFVLRFQLNTGCEYLPESVFSYRVSWKNVCHQAQSSVDFFSLPLELQGAPEESNQYNINIRSSQLVLCQKTSKLEVSIINQGGTSNGLTLAAERIRLTLPPDLAFLPQSLNGLYNFTTDTEPVSYFVDEQQILEWNLSPGVATSDSIVFSIDLLRENLSESLCTTLGFIIEIYQEAQVPCLAIGGGACDISFISQRDSFPDQIQEIDLQIEISNTYSIVFDSEHEQYHVLGTLLTNLEGRAEGNFVLEFYYDLNGDGLYQQGTDQYIQTENLRFTFDAAGQSIDFHNIIIVPVDSSCYGLLLLLQAENNDCLCSQRELYLPGFPLQNVGDSQIICLGDSIRIGDLPQSNYTYKWSPVGSLDQAFISNPYYSSSDTVLEDHLGIETLILTTTRASGCITSDTVLISTSKVSVEVDVGEEISCHNSVDGIVEAKIQGSIPPLQWEWGNGNRSDQALAGVSSGIYTITLTNALGCSDVDTLQLVNPPLLTLDLIENDLRCYQGSDGSILTEVGGGTSPYQYAWSNSAISVNLDGIQAGGYQVTITDAHGCTISRESILTEPSALELDILVTEESCAGTRDGRIEILEVKDSSLKYRLNDTPAFQYTPRFEQLSSGLHILHVVDSMLCHIELPISLRRPPWPLVKAPSDMIIDPGETVNLELDLHESVVKITWEADSTLTCWDCPAPDAHPLKETSYTVRIQTADGCIASDDITVYVRPIARVFAPNIFSPNGDGVNDKFFLSTREIGAIILDFKVFGRWGNLLFERHNISLNDSSVGWDGKLNGRDVDAGVYVYQARIRFENRKELIFSGDITIIR